MNTAKASRICNEIESKATCAAKFVTVRWTHVYATKEEIIEDLKKVVIPANGYAPVGTYRGYAYIHSFAKAVQNGRSLSEKQMSQCLRLALEIKKAASIACCY